MIIKLYEILIWISLFIGTYVTIYLIITLIENWGNHITPKKYKNLPNVCIIVPCYNEEKTVEKTIESLLKLDYPKKLLEIVVVDDGSTDNTFKEAKTYEKQGVKVYKKVNGGKHTALNLALKKTKAEFVGALDADSTVEKDALKKIISYFDNPMVMAVTPSMIINNPKGILKRIQYIEYIIGILLRRVFADVGSQHVTPGPFTIYRKAFFEKYGYYRKAHMTEDIEVALRIQSHNFLIENATDAYVYTHGPNTFYSLYKQRLRWYYGFIRNVFDYKKLFSSKHGNLGLFILPLSFISIGLMSVLVSYTLIKMVSNLIKTIRDYWLIGFDFSQLKLTFDSFFINNSPVTMMSLIALLLSVIIMIIAKSFTKEKKVFWSYILFSLIYSWFYVFWWFSAFIHIIIRKKVSWGHKSLTKK